MDKVQQLRIKIALCAFNATPITDYLGGKVTFGREISPPPIFYLDYTLEYATDTTKLKFNSTNIAVSLSFILGYSLIELELPQPVAPDLTSKSSSLRCSSTQTPPTLAYHTLAYHTLPHCTTYNKIQKSIVLPLLADQ